MLLKFALSLFICCTSYSFAQISDTVESQWKIGFSAESNYNYRNLQHFDEKWSKADDYTLSRIQEKAKIGFATTIFLSKNLSPHFNALIGLGMSERGYSRSTNYWSDEDGIYDLGTAVLNYHLRYFRIPCRLEYFSNFKRFSFFTNAGISLDFNTRSTVTANITYHNGDTEKLNFERNSRHLTNNGAVLEQGMNRTVASALLGVGVEIPLGDQLSFRLSSSANYGFISVFDLPIQENLWSVGLKVGLNLKL
jgi:hypothetical protein